MSTLRSFGWQAQRLADTAIGAAVAGGEKAADTLNPLRRPANASRELSRLQHRAATGLGKAERRGANARRRAFRTLRQQRERGLRRLRRNRREAKRQAKSAQDAFGRRVDEAQTAAEGMARRVVGSDARSIV